MKPVCTRLPPAVAASRPDAFCPWLGTCPQLTGLQLTGAPPFQWVLNQSGDQLQV